MSKVWLVYKESKIYDTHKKELVEVCGSKSTANIVMMHLSSEINHTKGLYEDEFESSYEEDLEYICSCSSLEMDEEKFIELNNRINLFQLQNPIVIVNKTFVEEREIKY